MSIESAAEHLRSDCRRASKNIMRSQTHYLITIAVRVKVHIEYKSGRPDMKPKGLRVCETSNRTVFTAKSEMLVASLHNPKRTVRRDTPTKQ